MLIGLYSAASAMETAQRQHEAHAQNLAHLQMPGYRRQQFVQSSQEANFAHEMQQAVNYQSLGITTQEQVSDFSPGTMEQTGNMFDLALNGNGFFVIEGPSGPLYTRNGTFQRTETGELVTAEGLSVKGENGSLRIPPGTADSEISIPTDGRVFAADQLVGKLAIVSFADTRSLAKVGITLFENAGTTEPTTADAQVMQGYRERANVSAMQELVAMISNQRLQEAARKSMTVMNEALGKHLGM